MDEFLFDLLQFIAPWSTHTITILLMCISQEFFSLTLRSRALPVAVC